MSESCFGECHNCSPIPPCKQPEFDATNPTVVPDAQQATTPANTTDQIATVVAYDWREDLDSIEACEEVSECADGCCTFFTPRHNDECIRLAAYIERLEAERDALLAEHEVYPFLNRTAWQAAHNNAERVIRGE